MKWINKLPKKHLAKVGIFGFLFFLLKGLMWIAITYFILR
jgi:hypothetical protein